jgi:hypothetical protein
MHLVIYFCGADDEGDSFGEKTNFTTNPEVRILFVQFCNSKELCSLYFSSNLLSFAHRFVNKLFKHRNGQIQLSTTDLNRLKIGIKNTPTLDQGDSHKKISAITLAGYSLGAVTCFNIAIKLNEIAPNIPVNIIANQPVLGNAYQGPNTTITNIANCCELKNLRNVTIILGAYTNRLADPNTFIKMFHRGFFSQIIPKLPQSGLELDLMVIPQKNYLELTSSPPIGAKYVHKQLENYLTDHVVHSTRATEAKKHLKSTNVFPIKESSQTIFNPKRGDFYHCSDTLCRLDYKQDMKFGLNETLIDWWKKYDKDGALYATKLTKSLVKKIQGTDRNDQEQLIALYKEADKWLMLKDVSGSSRYYQVQTLRNNIYTLLVQNFNIQPQKLDEINYNLLYEMRYFLKHWQILSDEASSHKTKETKELDRAFLSYANSSRPSEVSDKKLLKALDAWLEEKKESNNSRYDLVIQMRDQLSEMIEKIYPTLIKEEKEAA